MTIKESIERLKSHAHHNPLGLEAPCCVIIWLEEDIKQIEDSDKKPLTDEQRADILHELEANHDASEGISFTTLQYYVEDMQEEIQDPLEEALEIAKAAKATKKKATKKKSAKK